MQLLIGSGTGSEELSLLLPLFPLPLLVEFSMPLPLPHLLPLPLSLSRPLPLELELRCSPMRVLCVNNIAVTIFLSNMKYLNFQNNSDQNNVMIAFKMFTFH